MDYTFFQLHVWFVYFRNSIQIQLLFFLLLFAWFLFPELDFGGYFPRFLFALFPILPSRLLFVLLLAFFVGEFHQGAVLQLQIH